MDWNDVVCVMKETKIENEQCEILLSCIVQE